MLEYNCRSSRGSVDWNPATSGISILGIVAPLVGAWIEILQEFRSARRNTVAPLVGAWIEILSLYWSPTLTRSLLSWERGLKLPVSHVVGLLFSSLLSWERGLKYTHIIYIYLIHVAPLVGAWIQIKKRWRNTNSHTPSLLSWERGLKSFGKSKC